MSIKSRLLYLIVLASLLIVALVPNLVIAQSNCVNYTVRSGDNLFRIALNHGTNVDSLARLNGIYNPSLIYVGQVITICPGVTTTRTVTTTTVTTTSTVNVVPVVIVPTTPQVTQPVITTPKPTIQLIDPFQPCPFIANGAFADCGSYWLELQANYPVLFFSSCIPRTVMARANATGNMVCALTGDRWLALPIGVLNP